MGSELVDFGIGNTSIESEISIIRDSTLNSFFFLKPKKQFCYVRGLKFQIWDGDEDEFYVATNRRLSDRQDNLGYMINYFRFDFEIHKFYAKFSRFYLGTLYKLSVDCRLARGNPQWPGILDWFSKP